MELDFGKIGVFEFLTDKCVYSYISGTCEPRTKFFLTIGVFLSYLLEADSSIVSSDAPNGA